MPCWMWEWTKFTPTQLWYFVVWRSTWLKQQCCKCWYLVDGSVLEIKENFFMLWGMLVWSFNDSPALAVVSGEVNVIGVGRHLSGLLELVYCQILHGMVVFLSRPALGCNTSMLHLGEHLCIMASISCIHSSLWQNLSSTFVLDICPPLRIHLFSLLGVVPLFVASLTSVVFFLSQHAST